MNNKLQDRVNCDLGWIIWPEFKTKKYNFLTVWKSSLFLIYFSNSKFSVYLHTVHDILVNH